MHALKLILTGVLVVVALTAGLLVAGVVAVVGFAIYLVGRLLGKSGFPATSPKRRRQPNPMNSSDAIDVTATVVETTPTLDQPSPSEATDRIMA